MIRAHQAQHGGLVFKSALTRRQKVLRQRMTALAVIVAVAASAGILQQFHAKPAPNGPTAPDSGAYSAAR